MMRNDKVIIFPACLLVLVSGCSNKSNEVVRRAGRPDYVRTAGNELMDRAVQKAKDTHQDFVRALSSPPPQATGFAIKKPFPAGEGQEHIWLNEVSWDGKAFTATVNNDPVDTREVKLGDKVRVKPGEISDWMYVESGVLKGGFTIRVLYQQSSREEREELEKQTPFTVPPVDF